MPPSLEQAVCGATAGPRRWPSAPLTRKDWALGNGAFRDVDPQQRLLKMRFPKRIEDEPLPRISQLFFRARRRRFASRWRHFGRATHHAFALFDDYRQCLGVGIANAI